MSSKATLTLPSDLEFRMVRVFDAPREKVFAAHSRPEHLERWWGRGNPLDVEMDFRVGGRYRFVEHADDGEYGFRGEYLEIVEPTRIVYTFEWEGLPGHICTDTLDFTEQDGRTTLTSTTRFDSTEDRDGMLASGMETGANQSYEALERILPTI
jgi:uncharacterized protein YndB with AHSA1/START domain